MRRRAQPVGAGPRTRARAMTPPAATIAKEIRHSAVLAGSTNESRLISPGSEVQGNPVGPPSMDRAVAPLAMAGLDHDDPQAGKVKHTVEKAT